MTILYALVSLALLTVMNQLPAHATPILVDPSNQGPPGFGVNPATPWHSPIGQTFTAVSTDVTWIGVAISNCNCPLAPGITLTLYDGVGLNGAVIASRTVHTGPYGTGPNSFSYLDFTGTRLSVGSVYTLGVSQPSGSNDSLHGYSANVYADGFAILGGLPRLDQDFFLRVLDTPEIPPGPFMSVPKTGSVPEPSTAYLFAASIGAMLVLSRRRPT